MDEPTRTWTFPEIHPPGDGPWANEPDKAQWVDNATGLDCLVVRARTGALCGYVGVPPGHPWHGLHYDELDDVHAHGGLTFSGLCQEGAEDGPGVCHVPEPGRPAAVWWLGFDCAHIDDTTPTMDARLAALGHAQLNSMMSPRRTYRTLDYVRQEIGTLAGKVAAAAG